MVARTFRRVEVSIAGRALRPHAERLLDAHRDLVAGADATRAGHLGELRVGLLAGGAGAVLTPVLEAEALARRP
jgi:DNA-binding transcriptional LysR family regulator